MCMNDTIDWPFFVLCIWGYALSRFLMSNVFKCAMPLLWLGESWVYPSLSCLFCSWIIVDPHLTYRGPSTLATFVAVYSLFGPTFPGTYDKDRGVYTLFYPVCLPNTDPWDVLIFSFILFFLFRGAVALFYRGYHLLSQFHLSIRIAVMMERVLDLKLFILACSNNKDTK